LEYTARVTWDHSVMLLHISFRDIDAGRYSLPSYMDECEWKFPFSFFENSHFEVHKRKKGIWHYNNKRMSKL